MKKHTFNLSANIENGWEADAGYIATPNAKKSAAAIVSGFQSGIHSFTVIGTYGKKLTEEQRNEWTKVKGRFHNQQAA